MSNRIKKMTRNQKNKANPMSNREASKNSRYGRKRKYLDRNGGFGFQYAAPKPWK